MSLRARGVSMAAPPSARSRLRARGLSIGAAPQALGGGLRSLVQAAASDAARRLNAPALDASEPSASPAAGGGGRRLRRRSMEGGTVHRLDGPGFPVRLAAPSEGDAAAGVAAALIAGLIICVPELGATKERLDGQLSVLANAGARERARARRRPAEFGAHARTHAAHARTHARTHAHAL
jgi:hypothetical protein